MHLSTKYFSSSGNKQKDLITFKSSENNATTRHAKAGGLHKMTHLREAHTDKPIITKMFQSKLDNKIVEMYFSK